MPAQLHAITVPMTAALVVVDASSAWPRAVQYSNRSNFSRRPSATKLKTLQGEISFDEHGDMLSQV